MWKAADIRKAINEGRKPVPGPPGGDDDMLDSSKGVSFVGEMHLLFYLIICMLPFSIRFRKHFFWSPAFTSLMECQ